MRRRYGRHSPAVSLHAHARRVRPAPRRLPGRRVGQLRAAAASRRGADAGGIRGPGKPEWSPTIQARAEVLSWLGAATKGADALREEVDRGPTFGELAHRWWEGSRERLDRQAQGRGRRPATRRTTLKGYERTLRKRLLPEFGGRHAGRDHRGRLAALGRPAQRRRGSRGRGSRTSVSVVSAIYGWASRPTRRLVPRNPMRGVELPPNDEKPRTRVAPLEEAEQLLAALEPDDRVPYALAFYAGLRREEIYRLRWEDVELDGYRLRRPQVQERRRHGPPAADRRAAARDPPRGRAAEPLRRRGPGVRRVGHVRQASPPRDRRPGSGQA